MSRHDEPTAAVLGVTPLEACKLYRRPLSEIWLGFVWGLGETTPPIGRFDRWQCWYASPVDLEAVFGRTAKQRAAVATDTAWRSRAAERIARRRERAA